MTKLVTWILATFVVVSLSACNTIAGVGQDLQNLGSAIDKSDKKSEPKKDTNNSGVVVTPVK